MSQICTIGEKVPDIAENGGIHLPPKKFHKLLLDGGDDLVRNLSVSPSLSLALCLRAHSMFVELTYIYISGKAQVARANEYECDLCVRALTRRL